MDNTTFIIIMKERATVQQSVLLFTFLIVFGQQWRSMGQRNKLYQALDIQTILVSRINSVLVLVSSYRISAALSLNCSVIWHWTGFFHLKDANCRGDLKDTLTNTVNFPLSSSERRGSSWGWSLTIPSLRRVSWRKQITAGEVRPRSNHNRPSLWGEFLSVNNGELPAWLSCQEDPSLQGFHSFFPPLRRLCGSFLNSFFQAWEVSFPFTVVFTFFFSF